MAKIDSHECMLKFWYKRKAYFSINGMKFLKTNKIGLVKYTQLSKFMHYNISLIAYLKFKEQLEENPSLLRLLLVQIFHHKKYMSNSTCLL